MTWIVRTKSPYRLSAKLAAGLATCAFLAIAGSATSANARSADQQNLPDGYGGYYVAAPVAYGWPYGYGYYPPYAYYAQPYPYYGWPYYAPRAYYGPGARVSGP